MAGCPNLADLEVLNYDVLAGYGMWKSIDVLLPPKKGTSERASKTTLQCTIPTVLVSKFIVGEQVRGNTNFNRKVVYSREKQRENRATEKYPEPRSTEVLDKIRYTCAYGPQDLSCEPQVQVVEKGKRRKKILSRKSIKVGCQYAFSTAIFASDEINTLLTFQQHEHVTLVGELCHGPTFKKERKACAPWLSEWV